MTVTRFPVLCAALLLTTSAAAQPHPWPFELDPAVAADPPRVRQMIDELGEGLPQLPDGLRERRTDVVDLWFFPEIEEALVRAQSSGPGVEAPITRPTQTCPAHAAYVYPAALRSSGGFGCSELEDLVESLVGEAGDECAEVEYPETYVFDHPPGHVDAGVVSTLEGLIALAGEAFSHMDVPAGSLPPGWLETTRAIIAKVRYDELIAALDERLGDYAQASDIVEADLVCFDSAASATLLAQLAAMRAELERARAALQDLHEAGLARAAQDRQALAAQGRLRGELAAPSLTDAEREFLAFWLGGVYWRMRGAALVVDPPGTQETRLYYLLAPYTRIGEVTGGDDGEAAALDLYLRIFEGWGEWMDMGRTPGEADKYNDLVGMTDRGKYQVEQAAATLAGRGYDVRALYAGGLQMGPCYFYAWEEEDLAAFEWGTQPPPSPPYDVFIQGPTAIGEFCSGASIALGMARSLLYGRPDPTWVAPDDGGPLEPEPDGGALPPADDDVPPAQDQDAGAPSGDADADDARDDPTPPTGGCACATAGGPDVSLLAALALLVPRRGARRRVR